MESAPSCDFVASTIFASTIFGSRSLKSLQLAYSCRVLLI